MRCHPHLKREVPDRDAGRAPRRWDMRRILPGILLVMLLVAGLACASGPQADFEAVSTEVEYPDLEVEFTDLSTGEITRWEWDFTGNGRTDLTYEEKAFSVSYTYPKINRRYTVTLTVTGPGGNDTMTRQEYISVVGCPT